MYAADNHDPFLAIIFPRLLLKRTFYSRCGCERFPAFYGQHCIMLQVLLDSDAFKNKFDVPAVCGVDLQSESHDTPARVWFFCSKRERRACTHLRIQAQCVTSSHIRFRSCNGHLCEEHTLSLKTSFKLPLCTVSTLCPFFVPYTLPIIGCRTRFVIFFCQHSLVK